MKTEATGEQTWDAREGFVLWTCPGEPHPVNFQYREGFSLPEPTGPPRRLQGCSLGSL